jgi:DNA topoisomerase-1
MTTAKTKIAKKVARKKPAKSKGPKNLVIVESPAKARTIRKYLGRGYEVKSSVGHILDLPKSRLGVDVDNDFSTKLITIKGKASIIKELKQAAKKAEKIFLAPDPDREGEAIAQHISEVIDSPGKIYRVMFNEITKKAVTEAISHPHAIDGNRVDAQQARRILDRLVGYKLSPLLWSKIRRGLSAGRVQSVALRLIVEREKEVEAFEPKEYWSIECVLSHSEGEQGFEAKLHHVDGKKAEIGDGPTAKKIAEEIKTAEISVLSVSHKDRKRNAPPPFITSTLQQTASQRFRYTARKTMRIAQKLYEGVDIGHGEIMGLITYMRTDSTRVAAEALDEVRDFIDKKFGNKVDDSKAVANVPQNPYLPEKPNFYKVKKTAQEGHEAIRPTSVNRTPESLQGHLSPEELKLYALVWQRFVASQMTPAVIATTTLDAKAAKHTLRATGSRTKFDGFLRTYGSDENGKEPENIIPELHEGDPLKLREISPNQHFTQPPPRYSEATLIKELEEKGIGRPSTYASIMGTIIDREYVESIERKLHPTELGKTIAAALTEHFPKIMDVDFTAGMEENLDAIEAGKMNYLELLRKFYDPFNEALAAAEKNMKSYKTEEATDEKCDKCGKPMVIKYGRFGRFMACSGYPECKNTKEIGGNGKETGDAPKGTGEKCPACGEGEMIVKAGRFGRFLACSNYPTCKTTRPITTGIKCPKGCGGELAEKKTKKGRTFYSCTNYPKCDFASWEKPFDHKCEKCGSGYMVFDKGIDTNTIRIKCPVKGCDFKKQITKET